MSVINKRFLYKVYDSSGNYITTWDDVIDNPKFITAINGGSDFVRLRLARSANNFGEEDDIEFNNRVDIYVFDRDTTTDGVLIFSGYISEYTPTVEGKEEFLEVSLFSYFAELQRHMYEVNATGDTEIAFATVSPKTIFEDIFDEFTAAGGLVDYGVGTVDDPGTSVSYTFNTSTVKEALEKTLELCPERWYYRIDPDNVAYLKETPSATGPADHTFTIGKNVVLVQPQKRVQSVINKIYFVGGDPGAGKLYKKYTRNASITSYGLYSKKYVDERVTVEATADTIAEKILDTFQNPEIRTKIIVPDNNGSPDLFGYDIENIKVGQTARVVGFTSEDFTRWDEAIWDVDVWDYSVTNITAIPQQIQKIIYRADHVELELSNRLPDIAKRIEDINRNLVDSQTADNPTAPIT